MSKKLLFFDIDGTLVSFDGKMPDSTADALRKAQKKGHEIFLCTGRSHNQIYDFLLDFGFDGIVGGTGCYVEYHGKELLHNTFTKDQLQQVVDCFKDNQGGIICQRKDDCIFPSASEAPFIRAYADNMKLERITDSPAFTKLFVDDDLAGYPERYDDVESILYCESPYNTEEMRSRVTPDICVETASFRQPEPYSGEITLAANTKETGIQAVLDYLGKTKDDIIAFGDGANDLAMLDFAGYSVVMDNALDKIKEHGDYITAAVDKDGIYLAMDYLKLI